MSLRDPALVSRIVAAGVSAVFVLIALQAGAAMGRGIWFLAGTVIGGAAVAALSLWYAVAAHGGVANVRWRRSLRMALIVGLVALVAGYVAPLVIAPDNNLGPLLGIFGTGPTGFAFGALAGFVLSRRDVDAPS